MTLASSIQTPHVDWFALSPSLVLLGAAAVCLLAAVLVPKRHRHWLTACVTAGAFVGAFVAAALLYDRSPQPELLIGDAIVRDRFGALAAMIVCGAGLASVGVSWRMRLRAHRAEYYALLAAAAGGMVFLVTATSLITLFLSLEWFSICLYILCAIDGELEGSLEAGLKYLVVGGVGSAFLLFGSALVYGVTGQTVFTKIADSIAAGNHQHDALLVTGLAMIIAGLGFKASAAPFHMWTPDVYEGAPTPVTAFMSAATKTAALALTLRLMTTAFPAEKELWTIALAVIAVASLAIGNLGALTQRNVKRMLAYSSISHAGFMLMPIAAGNALGGRALLYYLIPYSAMSVAAFAVVAARERELGQTVTFDNIAGMGWERPFLGVAMWICMLGFAGLPLTGGFVGKFYSFSAVYDRGWVWLVIVGAVATAVSLYYYFGLVRAMYMRAPEPVGLAPAGGQPPRELALQTAVLGCMVFAVGSFFFVEPLIKLARMAASSLSYPF
ncbi:MAG TPA: NADH-quinone oxidoreductase subunit N [Gaiellaceae bacterium]|jgi:NADH-quinone oxidoreductase subunit N|nr:NADH-quinone oxidoreductase subunit N [Gaiellaceae bacterium]